MSRYKKRRSSKHIAEIAATAEAEQITDLVPIEVVEHKPEMTNAENGEKMDEKKFPFNLLNLGTDTDTLILLALAFLLMQDENMDTLLLCMLGYILLG